MANTDFQPINSSNLQGGSFDAASQSCKVQFKTGSIYEYGPVTPEEWADFQATFQTEESSGRFFASFIKPKAFTRIK